MERESFSTKAIIINNRYFKEYDSLITVYTLYQGKLELISRGTQKPSSKLVGHLQPFTLVNLMVIPGKGFDYVGSVSNLQSYFNIKADLNALYYAGQALAFINKELKTEEKDEDVFLLLKEYLDFLEKEKIAKGKHEILVFAFLLKLVSVLGYQPQLDNCSRCNKTILPQKNYFDFLGGSVLCEKCYSQIRDKTHLLTVSEKDIKVLRFLIKENFEEIKKIGIIKKDILKFYNYFNYLK